jgi:ABC-2 type transport system ATP-binding protein
MISVDGISKYYGDFAAVNNISFEINSGEITGLLGPNGAGKTTTLRMLTGYLKPDGGKINIAGHDSETESIETKKLIGYLPESAPLYPDMTVYDYLKFIAEIRGISKDAIDGKIEKTAGLYGIREVMHKNISELSKGYRQRTGLAQALIHDPEILILDEPTSGLDPNQIIEIRNLIKEIGREKTVILSTHILSEVEASCARVIIINNGTIAADEKTSTLQNLKSGSRKITVKISGTDYSGFAEAVQSINGVAGIEKISDQAIVEASISCAGDSSVEPEIFRCIASRGWNLHEMKQDQTSLENIFRELTRGAGSPDNTGGGNE